MLAARYLSTYSSTAAPTGECSQPASGKGSSCSSHSASQLVKYDLTLTWGKMTIAGVKRPVILTNGQYPAPLINVSVGDRVVITVHNQLQVLALQWAVDDEAGPHRSQSAAGACIAVGCR